MQVDGLERDALKGASQSVVGQGPVEGVAVGGGN
jgi:hypothetical protein